MGLSFHESRQKKVRKIIDSFSLDGILFNSLENIRYLCGFTGSDGLLLITKEETFFLSDSRYWTQAEVEIKEAKIIHYKKKLDGITSLISDLGLKDIGFESNSITFSFYQSLSKRLINESKFIPLEEEIKNLRAVKDKKELDLIRTAIDISSKAFEHIQGILKEGVLESRIALDMEFFMKHNGAQSIGFDIIVASGKRSALPHGKASDKNIEKGDFILIDFGAGFEGYHSDQTRTLVCGKPSWEQRNIYRLVKEAHDMAIELIRPGISINQVDEIARAHIRDHGYGEFFGHGLGHGIGLSIHEDPTINGDNKDILENGMVFTIEPGIYIPNWGGVRIEDMILVTDHGSERLTYLPTDLIEI